MSVGLFASGLREHRRRGPSADGPGLGAVDTAIKEFFQFPESCIVAPIRTQGPLEHVIFDRLSEPLPLVGGYAGRAGAEFPLR